MVHPNKLILSNGDTLLNISIEEHEQNKKEKD